MKKSLLVLLFLPIVFCTKVEAYTSAQNYKQYINLVQGKSATFYNALNLSDEQIKIREELIKEYEPLYDEKFKELIKESSKLKALICANAGEITIRRQELLVLKIKENIKKMLDAENKTFKKCLTHEQRSKFNMLKKLQKDDYKKNCRTQKDYYKLNPKMKEFGNPPRYDYVCDCEKNSK